MRTCARATDPLLPSRPLPHPLHHLSSPPSSLAALPPLSQSGAHRARELSACMGARLFARSRSTQMARDAPRPRATGESRDRPCRDKYRSYSTKSRARASIPKRHGSQAHRVVASNIASKLSQVARIQQRHRINIASAAQAASRRRVIAWKARCLQALLYSKSRSAFSQRTGWPGCPGRQSASPSAMRERVAPPVPKSGPNELSL